MNDDLEHNETCRILTFNETTHSRCQCPCHDPDERLGRVPAARLSHERGADADLRAAAVRLREAAVKAGAHIVVTTDYPDGVKAFGILCDAIDVMDNALEALSVPAPTLPAPSPARLREAMDFLDGALDDTHPEGDGCDICRAADLLREAIEPSEVRDAV